MGNYGRGWNDGYGGQSKEAIDEAWEKDEAEYYQQISRAKTKRNTETKEKQQCLTKHIK